MQRKRIFTMWVVLLLSLVVATPAFASGRPIALDSGHGGGDEGAVYGSFVERDMNWEITKACRDELEAMGYSVVIVNTSSQNYDLDDRVQRAVNNNAPVIVSLHNNAWDRVSKEKRGCTVLVPNSSSYEGGLYDIGQRFAAEVTSGLKDELGIPLWKDGSYERDYPAGESGSTYPDGSRADYYAIVRYARRQGIFGCIIEHGFLDSAEDAKIYNRSDTLTRMGIVDAHAIATFYDEFCEYADESQEARIASGWWVASGERWWFRYSNGTYPAGRMAQIKGVTYGFDQSGWMVVGWGKFDGTWYWFDKDGALAHDTWTDDGYYIGSDGSWDKSVPRREPEKKDSPDEKPKAQAKWIRSGSRWWYQHADGTYTTSGWEKIDDVWYLFDASGWMRTGWAKDGGTWYYLRSSGAMASGWEKVDGTWYYLKDSGAMAIGWQQVNGTWYYLRDSGAMATGWQQVNGAWYYLRDSGAMATGWQQVNGAWYYLKDSGAMATGWVKSGSKWYYLGSDGAMYVNRTTPDGYQVDGSGAWVN